jgi:hypothetical protein
LASSDRPEDRSNSTVTLFVPRAKSRPAGGGSHSNSSGTRLAIRARRATRGNPQFSTRDPDTHAWPHSLPPISRHRYSDRLTLGDFRWPFDLTVCWSRLCRAGLLDCCC